MAKFIAVLSVIAASTFAAPNNYRQEGFGLRYDSFGAPRHDSIGSSYGIIDDGNKTSNNPKANPHNYYADRGNLDRGYNQSITNNSSIVNHMGNPGYGGGWYGYRDHARVGGTGQGPANPTVAPRRSSDAGNWYRDNASEGRIRQGSQIGFTQVPPTVTPHRSNNAGGWYNDRKNDTRIGQSQIFPSTTPRRNNGRQGWYGDHSNGGGSGQDIQTSGSLAPFTAAPRGNHSAGGWYKDREYDTRNGRGQIPSHSSNDRQGWYGDRGIGQGQIPPSVAPPRNDIAGGWYGNRTNEGRIGHDVQIGGRHNHGSGGWYNGSPNLGRDIKYNGTEIGNRFIPPSAGPHGYYGNRYQI